MAMLSKSNEAATTQESRWTIFLPRGRIGRVTYITRWAAALFGCYFINWLRTAAQGSGFEPLVTFLIYVVFAFMVVTSIKRLHDLGYSSWAVIILGGIVPLLALAPGEHGSNAYGNPPPKPFTRSDNSAQRQPVAK